MDDLDFSDIIEVTPDPVFDSARCAARLARMKALENEARLHQEFTADFADEVECVDLKQDNKNIAGFFSLGLSMGVTLAVMVGYFYGMAGQRGLVVLLCICCTGAAIGNAVYRW